MISAVLDFLSNVLSVLLAPIDLMLEALLPNLSTTFEAVYDFFEIIFSNIGFALDLFAVPPFVISLIISLYVFKLTLPIQVYIFKLVLNWYDKIKG